MEQGSIIQAARFARFAHAGQRRKWGDDPYIVHPMRVAGRVALLDDATDDMVCAAWLHDVCEDCGVQSDVIRDHFGWPVAGLVIQLTNPSKRLPADTPRASKKRVDREHAAVMPDAAKRIKLADRWDNVRSLRNAPRDFVELYVGETRRLIEVIGDAEPGLAAEVLRECDEA